MDLKKLYQDDDAVSPVIGVILMVAITVILAAVIASFVLNLGGETSTTPQASFNFEYDSSASPATGSGLYSGGDGGELTITHDSGDSIQAGRLTITDEGGDGELTGPDLWGGDAASQISAGSSGTVAIDDDDTVRIIYTDDSGEDSTTLATWEAPSA